MIDSLLTISALDGSNNPVTLRFSMSGYINSSKQYYEPRIIEPAMVSIFPNTGGLLSALKVSSIGDISLSNKDGELDYLANYAVDGRLVVLEQVNTDGSITERFRGTIGLMSEVNDNITFSLRSPQDILSNDHPMLTYAGTNTGLLGLEGTADSIKDSQKPKVYGYCKGISPIAVNEPLLIYQVSSLANCRVIRVYDNGVQLINYRVSGNHASGVSVIQLMYGLNGFAIGKHVIFGNHMKIYEVQAYNAATKVITLTVGLDVAVDNDVSIDCIDFYNSFSDITDTDYIVSTDYAVGSKDIVLSNGVGAIASGTRVKFNSIKGIYTVNVGLSSYHIVLTNGILEPLKKGSIVRIVEDANPALWGSYQGYVRLASQPAGAITVDAISVDGSNVILNLGGVINYIASERSITMDSASITLLDSQGMAGLYISDLISTTDMLDQLIQSVAGYYYFLSDVLYAKLLDIPSVTPTLTIYDFKDISRVALGLGSNGIPSYKVNCDYDKIETVQSTVAGSVPASWANRVKKQFKKFTLSDGAVLTRHQLSLETKIICLFSNKSSVNSIVTRLLDLIKSRRDVIDIEVDSYEYGIPVIGNTVEVKSKRLGYLSGRNFVILGYDIDDTKMSIIIRLIG